MSAVWFKSEHRKRAVLYGTVSAERKFGAKMCHVQMSLII